jgi:hypothetical protein
MFKRFLTTSSRLLNQATSATGTTTSTASKRLPRLTLYTGGPECSLCEVSHPRSSAPSLSLSFHGVRSSEYSRETKRSYLPCYHTTQIAKQDLQVIRYTHPFDLETFNIHDPPSTVDQEKASQIRDDYKFDIVSLSGPASPAVTRTLCGFYDDN